MIKYKNIDDLEARLPDEFTYLEKKFPSVAFNVSDWWGGANDRSRGKNILFATEGFITYPNNYNPDFIRKYDVTIMTNGKFKEQHPELNIVLLDAPPRMDNFYEIDEFLSYDEKIKGICSLQKVYHTGNEGDINFMKHSVMAELYGNPELVVHTFGPASFGNPASYQGNLGFKYGHFNNLKKINEYLFCWCPESTYHPLWSYGHVTERLFNCFRSKTIAVYYGCYNIEDYIPTHLFVDYRNFQSAKQLRHYLIDFAKDKKRYEDMVEEAFQWNLNCKLGEISTLENTLVDCINKYPFK